MRCRKLQPTVEGYYMVEATATAPESSTRLGLFSLREGTLDGNRGSNF
jgi:hypothetical protein